MAKVAVTKAKLEALADAIRQKAGLSGKKTLAELTQAVSDLGTGTDTSDATAGAAQVLAGYTAYGPDGKFSGTIESFNGLVLSPSNANRIIKGNRYLASDLTVKAALLQDRTVIPSATRQTIAKNDDQFYGLGTVTVEAAPLEERTVTPGETAQVITPSGGKIGMSKVTVAAVAPGIKALGTTIQGSGSNTLEIDNTLGLTSIRACEVVCATEYANITESGVVYSGLLVDGENVAKVTARTLNTTRLAYSEDFRAMIDEGKFVLYVNNTTYKFSSDRRYSLTIYGT